MATSLSDSSAMLRKAVDAAEPLLTRESDAEAAKPVLAGGWSRKQLIGHLIDSASNNHQRFVRAVMQDSLTLPGYEQDAWSQAQHAHEADWPVLVGLWVNYNRYLAHIIARIPPDKLDTLCLIGADAPVTLGFLVDDYLDHLGHHLRQLGITL